MRIFKQSNSSSTIQQTDENHPFLVDIQCAWCGKYLGMMPSKHNKITHRICEKCMKEVEEDYHKSIVSVN